MSRFAFRSDRQRLAVFKVVCFCVLALQALAVACLPRFGDYGLMCSVSLAQLGLFVVLGVLSPTRQPFFILFIVANWIFHCGQIACIAAGHNEVLNLDFRLYGSQTTIEDAFRFYLCSQALIAAGGLLCQKPAERDTAAKSEWGLSGSKRQIALILILVGLPFWLYISLSKMAGAAADGYRGVYSLVIPAPVQALAFFVEAGLLLLLLDCGKRPAGPKLFWAVVAVKVILMTTGGRQDQVCFLAVWFLVYYGYLRKMTAARMVGMAVAAVALLFAVDAFGELRTAGFSMDAMADYLSKASFLDVFWDSLGEFGCAFSTLVVCVAYIPSGLGFGMGSSYLAGVMSVIPTLVGHFPALKAATLFTTSIPGTAFFGGSMLGEFYYNFGWFGLAGTFLLGAGVAWCQNRFNDIGESVPGFRVWAAVVMGMFLLLFVRGYFTDAVMKVAYLFAFVWAVNSVIQQARMRKGRFTEGRAEDVAL